MFTCQMWNRKNTKYEVETDDMDLAPDLYANKYVKMEVGDVVFIEVIETCHLWRTEMIWSSFGKGYVSSLCSYQEAEDELARRAKLN